MKDHVDTERDAGIWGEKGYMTLRELGGLFLLSAVVLAVVAFPFYNLGRWVGTLIHENAFDWGIPSVETFGWYAGGLVLVFSGIAGSNAQRLWAVDGGWSPRVLANLILTAGGLTFSLILLWLLVASTFL